MTMLKGNLTRATTAEAAVELEAMLQGSGSLALDLSQVTAVDSAGAALLATFVRRAEKAGRQVQLLAVHPAVARTLRLFPFMQQRAVPTPKVTPLTERLGGFYEYTRTLLLEYTILCADVAWFMVTGLFKRRGIRYRAVLLEMFNMGSQAMGVVGLIGFLVGGTVALQSAAQLRQFGANLFVADLIGVSITRELGPLMTAIVVAGRSGSAVAAEIATMMITEEVDSLKTMGLNPTRFIIVPKVLAITLTQPVLTVFANILAIFGGFLVAIFYLDVSAAAFMGRLQTALYVKDILTGLFKSLLFANLIVTIGALCGLRTTGGADAVGRSTTTSVVAAIFAIIVADAFCSLFFYFGG